MSRTTNTHRFLSQLLQGSVEPSLLKLIGLVLVTPLVTCLLVAIIARYTVAKPKAPVPHAISAAVHPKPSPPPSPPAPAHVEPEPETAEADKESDPPVQQESSVSPEPEIPEEEVAVPPPVPPPPVVAPPPPQRRITVTSTQQQWEGEGPPEALIDGNPKTRWSSEYKDGQKIEIDLGAETKVAGLRLLWENASAQKYSVALSSDGQTWKTVGVRTSDVAGSRTDEIGLGDATTRHILINLIKRATEWGFSLYEIEIIPAP